MKVVFLVAKNLKAHHENTKDQKHQKRNSQNFVSPYFRAFVIVFSFWFWLVQVEKKDSKSIPPLSTLPGQKPLE